MNWANNSGRPRSDDLAQADLAGPLAGAGRGQVHEVDAGDPEDEEGDGGEDA